MLIITWKPEAVPPAPKGCGPSQRYNPVKKTCEPLPISGKETQVCGVKNKPPCPPDPFGGLLSHLGIFAGDGRDDYWEGKKSKCLKGGGLWNTKTRQCHADLQSALKPLPPGGTTGQNEP